MFMSDFYVITQWRSYFYNYCCKRINYFKTKNIDNRLLIFDVKQDTSKKIVDFFDEFAITLDSDKWGHDGSTKHYENIDRQKDGQN